MPSNVLTEEITAMEDHFVGRKDQRIIRGGIELDLDDPVVEVEYVESSTEDLRQATNGIRVLWKIVFNASINLTAVQ